MTVTYVIVAISNTNLSFIYSNYHLLIGLQYGMFQVLCSIHYDSRSIKTISFDRKTHMKQFEFNLQIVARITYSNVTGSGSVMHSGSLRIVFFVEFASLFDVRRVSSNVL